MNTTKILNKLKLLDIRNPWIISVVKELSKRRGASANVDALFRDTRRRLKAGHDQLAKNKFNRAVADLLQHELVYQKTTAVSLRLHLLTAVWELEDAIVDSILVSTIRLSKGRKNTIRWRTILKEVRKELSLHHIKLSYKVTKTLVPYFLLRQCSWKFNSDGILLAPKKMLQKIETSPEQQQDLFH